MKLCEIIQFLILWIENQVFAHRNFFINKIRWIESYEQVMNNYNFFWFLLISFFFNDFDDYH